MAILNGKTLGTTLKNTLVKKLPSKLRSLFMQSDPSLTGKHKIAVRASSSNNPDWRCKLYWPDLTDMESVIFKNLPGGTTVIWPYTPQFDINYQASYELVKTLQTNYATPAYQSSDISSITITGQFTATTVAEANYLFAVIHFLKSATKGYNVEIEKAAAMSGRPPPLLRLTYLGQGGIRSMPVLLQQFNVSYPQDVDYVRTDLNVNSGDTTTAKKSDNSTVKITLNTINDVPPPSMVPSEMNISVTLIPAYNRAHMISSEYSTTKFIKGELIDKGYF